MKNSTITIFTPTYNRLHTINNLFRSLLRQTQKNFEWIVIDDGSTDNTEQYFCDLTSQPQPFQIRYIKQENKGKHRAINRAVNIANGPLFFIVDSDDYLTDNAIEKINQWFVFLDKSHKWAGFSGLRGYSTNEVVGQRNNSTLFIDAKNTERRKYKLIGDKAEIYFTDILKKYPFPEIFGENFISEEIVWNNIARDGYYLRWFNEIIYICNYQNDGLTKNLEQKNRQNPIGLCLWAKNQIKSFPYNYIEQMLAIMCYHNAVSKKFSNKEIANNLGISRPYLYTAIFLSKVSSFFHLKH